MFRSITDRIARDADYPPRQRAIDINARVLDGSLYDHIPQAFHDEKSAAGEYVPLRDRRPSVRMNICRTVVDDSVALLFSEGHFPIPEIDNVDQRADLLALLKGARLNEVMIEAATIGSVGSVAIQVRALPQADGTHELFFEAHSTEFLTPVFDRANPNRLVKLVERYKVRGDVLAAQGYIIDPSAQASAFWFQREWDGTAETWFLPYPVIPTGEPKAPEVDEARTVRHDLGFVPWVWVRNLPGKLKIAPGSEAAPPRYSDVDGQCTFAAAVETMVEIEYLLSQSGRGLRYSMDPQLVLKEPPSPDREFVKGPANALIVDEKGDAKLLEIEGTAFTVVLEWVRALREFALESVHGNRADPQKLSAAQSGRAMEMMNQALVWLADKLRISYGEGAYRELIVLALRAHAKFPLTVEGRELPPIDPKQAVSLKWPDWYAPTATDLQTKAETIRSLRDSKTISRHTATTAVAFAFDIEDVEAEIARIDADTRADLAMVVAANGQVAEQIKVST